MTLIKESYRVIYFLVVSRCLHFTYSCKRLEYHEDDDDESKKEEYQDT